MVEIPDDVAKNVAATSASGAPTGRRRVVELPDLDAIEARANAATDGPWVTVRTPDGELVPVGPAYCDADAHFIAHARADVPALVAALREARAEVERLTCRHSLSSDGDEGPVVNLPGLFVVRWHCNECDGKWYDDNALAHLRDTIRSQTDSLNAAEAEVERLRTQHAADLDRVTLLRARAVVAERDDWRRRYEALRADYNHLNERLDFAVETGSKMIKRYEALRDGVTGLCDDPDPDTDDGMTLISVDAIRAVVARVEGDES